MMHTPGSVRLRGDKVTTLHGMLNMQGYGRDDGWPQSVKVLTSRIGGVTESMYLNRESVLRNAVLLTFFSEGAGRCETAILKATNVQDHWTITLDQLTG